MTFDIEAYQKRIDALCDFIAEHQALSAQFRSYCNDAVDVDKEGCFV